eukprot:m.334800 g.334800  ORF g.334800 m.334800 type:complete len:138 (+) comp20515_c0_seq4:1328-1741(+)
MYSSAQYWALPNMAPVGGGATPTKMLTEDGPTPFPGCKVLQYTTSKTPEAVLVIEQDGGILVSCDSWMNWAERDAYMDDASFQNMEKMGFFAPVSCTCAQHLSACVSTLTNATLHSMSCNIRSLHKHSIQPDSMCHV